MLCRSERLVGAGACDRIDDGGAVNETAGGRLVFVESNTGARGLFGLLVDRRRRFSS
jgi:hypothetical protein